MTVLLQDMLSDLSLEFRECADGSECPICFARKENTMKTATDRAQLNIDVKRREVFEYLYTLPYTELEEVEAQTYKRTSREIIDRLMGAEFRVIEKIHNDAGLDEQE